MNIKRSFYFHLRATKFMDPKRTQLLLLFFAFLCTRGRKLNGDSIPGCIPTERNALLGFKEGLKDPTSRLSSWVGDDCCAWNGVACDNRTGHVYKLDLHSPFNQPLGGELRPSLLGLKRLNYLDLSMNNFEGIRIPEFMGSFRQLKHLDLYDAGFGGSIPHQLGNLSSLQYLDLSSEFEVDIDDALWISRLSSLQYLRIRHARFGEGARWVQALNMLPSIVEVHLIAGDVNPIPPSLPHVNFSSLSVLNLAGDSISSMLPGWLFNISSLEHLDLGNNLIPVIIPPAIKNLASLRFLDLFDNLLVDSKIPAALGGLCKLQNLGLSGINMRKNLHEFDEIFTGCIKNSLEALDMGDNQLSGFLPDCFGDFKMLKSLDLSFNSISGPLPASIGGMSALEELDLSHNKLNGTVTESLGRLSELVSLDLNSNFLVGAMSEEHFAYLNKLNHLDLSKNQLIINLGPDWIPPFQLRKLCIGSCRLGPQFPAWLRRQENISDLDLSGTGISDTMPDWFWRSFSHIHSLTISNNGITGSVPDLTDFTNLAFLNLSSNYFEGPLPNFNSFAMDMGVDLSNNSFSGVIHPNIAKSMPYLLYLSLSANKLSGEIPLSLCQLGCEVLDLSKNRLLGEIPDCWYNTSSIMVIDFSSNNLFGSFPPSICSLPYLSSLHLSNNNLSGELPLSLKGCESLVSLDLRQNGFTGAVPTCIGESLLSLKILSLRSNKFVGNIPPNLSSLSALRILDLADNNLSGTIPSSFGNFTAMKVSRVTYERVVDVPTIFGDISYKDDIQVTTKGRDFDYNILLPLMIAMNLADNNLTGMIPEELSNLYGLMSLNLSGNHLTGKIIENISALQMLESLDLSRNNLSGRIPSSMIALTFLSYLNMSYNNLSGRIPRGNQLQTFTDPSIYIGNSGLCGFPLSQTCKDDDTSQGPNDNAMDEEESEMNWLYMSMGLGFAIGLWTIFGPLFFNRKWREAYFRLIDQVYDMVYVALAVIFGRFKQHNVAA